MKFSIKIALSTFQRAMSPVSLTVQQQFALIYQVDVFIYPRFINDSPVYRQGVMDLLLGGSISFKLENRFSFEGHIYY